MPSYADFAARNFRKQGHSDSGCGVNAYLPMDGARKIVQMITIFGTNIKDRISNQIQIKMENSNYKGGRNTIVSTQKIVYQRNSTTKASVSEKRKGCGNYLVGYSTSLILVKQR